MGHCVQRREQGLMAVKPDQQLEVVRVGLLLGRDGRVAIVPNTNTAECSMRPSGTSELDCDAFLPIYYLYYSKLSDGLLVVEDG